MPTPVSDPLENRILRILPRDEIKRLQPNLELVTLENRKILCEAGGTIEHVYFPTSGVVSWLATEETGSTVEVATVGNEGMVGYRLLLGTGTSPAKIMVQVPGAAYRMTSTALTAERKCSSPFLEAVHRCLNAFLTQVTQSVACNTLHTVEKRICRWLLMTHDRVRSDHFPMTHELMAQMLGVRRAGVTVAARKLQKAGLIKYVHGKVTVLDRAGLEATSCRCYHVVKEEYDRLLP